MKYDVILSGVGGQGVLSVAAVIAKSAVSEGLTVRQSEVHGMAQRGGAVLAHLRIADGPVSCDLIGKGDAEMILSMEPLEALRYLDYLKPDGVLITAENPFKNIPDYPDPDELKQKTASVQGSIILDAGALARQAGSSRSVNMVMVGAASKSLPIKAESIEKTITDFFASKGKGVGDINIKAFRLGREGRRA
jgi:indolepyruvate ferredoxin oxidoreductase beta subunit